MCVTWWWWGGGWGLWLWYDEDDYSGDNLDKDDDDDDDDDDIATSPRLRTDSVKSPGFPLLGLRSGFLSSSGIVIILFMFSPDRNPRYKNYHIIIVHQWSPGKKTSIAPSLKEQVLRLDSMDVWVEPTSAGHYDSLSLSVFITGQLNILTIDPPFTPPALLMLARHFYFRLTFLSQFHFHFQDIWKS